MSALFLCHLLIGIPGSGKSTFARRLAELGNYRIVSTDAIRQELYGDERIQGDWAAIEMKVLSRIREAIEEGQSAIYDATNAKREWRVDFLQKVNATGSHFPPPVWMAWYLTIPLEIAKSRNQMRSRAVPDAAIESMFKYLQDFPPIVEEGFAAVNAIDAAGEINWAEIEEKIQRFFSQGTQ